MINRNTKRLAIWLTTHKPLSNDERAWLYNRRKADHKFMCAADRRYIGG